MAVSDGAAGYSTMCGKGKFGPREWVGAGRELEEVDELHYSTLLRNRLN